MRIRFNLLIYFFSFLLLFSFVSFAGDDSKKNKDTDCGPGQKKVVSRAERYLQMLEESKKNEEERVKKVTQVRTAKAEDGNKANFNKMIAYLVDFLRTAEDKDQDPKEAKKKIDRIPYKVLFDLGFYKIKTFKRDPVNTKTGDLHYKIDSKNGPSDVTDRKRDDEVAQQVKALQFMQRIKIVGQFPILELYERRDREFKKPVDSNDNKFKIDEISNPTIVFTPQFLALVYDPLQRMNANDFTIDGLQKMKEVMSEEDFDRMLESKGYERKGISKAEEDELVAKAPYCYVEEKKAKEGKDNSSLVQLPGGEAKAYTRYNPDFKLESSGLPKSFETIPEKHPGIRVCKKHLFCTICGKNIPASDIDKIGATGGPFYQYGHVDCVKNFNSAHMFYLRNR